MTLVTLRAPGASIPPLRGAPLWLVLAAAILIGETAILFAFGPGAGTAISLALSILISTLMLRRSKLAWGIALIATLGQVVDSLVGGRHYWSGAAGAVTFGLLLLPVSVRFVWGQAEGRHGSGALLWQSTRGYLALRLACRGVITRLAGWDAGGSDAEVGYAQRGYGVLIWRLGLGCFFLLLLVGGTYEWEMSSGGGSFVVTLIARITRLCWILALLAFVAAIGVAVFFRAVGPRGSRSPSETHRGERTPSDRR